MLSLIQNHVIDYKIILLKQNIVWLKIRGHQFIGTVKAVYWIGVFFCLRTRIHFLNRTNGKYL
ncbi:hypothetical protein CN575_00105 [Bacillus wiedmannii]|uniref:Uncharacterized protein n=1 Tax=Bacillus wiedmannii TaxID=1890302 RepID=A0A2A7J8K5_9BACI|nr:hypothetical protein CT694_18735 [Bacillus wiedmannii bv. thuringiensis]OTY00281.1 hypothetical protein BK729_11510 [Bacillus thuringiensis serovar wratislaviensis]OUB60340.1 hypothetical protein BK743_10720 [Bacillus thuringiensis serovar sylvestriensis]PDZ43974.1 hypothetical protein CON82_21480 [Bacillus wiedmannii]PEA75436.1 hypothetical protein CON92_24560 [Bacillus wiedmannii]